MHGDKLKIGASCFLVHIHNQDELDDYESKEGSKISEDIIEWESLEKFSGCFVCGWGLNDRSCEDRVIDLRKTGTKEKEPKVNITQKFKEEVLDPLNQLNLVPKQDKLKIATGQQPAYTVSTDFDKMDYEEEEEEVIKIDKSSIPYTNRAKMRRLRDGKILIDEFGKTKKIVKAAVVPSYGKGMDMLKKMGWRDGNGLGINQEGEVTIVEGVVKKNKFGIGKIQ